MTRTYISQGVFDATAMCVCASTATRCNLTMVVLVFSLCPQGLMNSFMTVW